MAISNPVIDISHHNSNVNLKRAKEEGGILGVIQKASQGQSNIDPTYRRNRSRAAREDLLWGAYHFGTGSGLTSTVGERLANLVQREIVVRTGMENCRVHAKTWELLRLTRMPAVRVDLGYLTSPKDRDRLVNPLFREQIVEAMLAAVQRMYYPVENDVPTGSIDVRQLRMAIASRRA